MPSPARGPRPSSEPPPLTTSSNPVARTGREPRPVMATCTRPPRMADGRADDRPVDRPPVELGVRATGRLGGDADVDDQLVVGERRRAGSRRRSRPPRSCGVPEALRTITEPPTASSDGRQVAVRVGVGQRAADRAAVAHRLVADAARRLGDDAGSRAGARPTRAMSRCRVTAPITSSSPSRADAASARRCRAMSTSASGAASRSFIAGSSDWPPAIGLAPSRDGGERLVERCRLARR